MNNISFTRRTGSPWETVYDVVNFQTDDKWVEVGFFFFFFFGKRAISLLLIRYL